MIFAIATLLIKIFGCDFEKAVRIARWILVGVVVCVLIAGVIMFRSCGGRKVKLNEKQIQDAKIAIAENDRQAMEKVLVESEVAEKQIDDNLANAKTETVNAIHEAKKKASEMSNAELAAELERRLNQ